MTQTVTTSASRHASKVENSSGAAPTVPRPPAFWERRPRLALALLLLTGVVVYMPSLRCSFLLDDYLHASMIDGTFPVRRGPFDLYNFVDDGDRAALVARGMLPWWSDPTLKLRFFRPLSSVLRWVEHRAIGGAPLLMHLHSLLWWAAAVLAARALFRRVLGPRPALLATIVFALAPCHALPLGWLANREVLISITLGTLGLSSYLRWRSEGDLLAAALFGASLLGGEYGFCLGGYVLAFELTAHEDALLRRVGGLLVFGAPAAGYLWVRARLGYGTRGSGFYTDPFREPRAFLEAAPRRLATLVAKAWLSLDTTTLNDAPAWALGLIVAGGAALLYVPLGRTFARLPPPERRAATWLLLGSFLALGPVLAVLPSPRLCGASLLGVAAVVAVLLDGAWFPAAGEERGRAAELTGFAALGLAFAHLVHAPVTSWLTGQYFAKEATEFRAHVRALSARLDDPASAEIIILRGVGSSFFMPFGLAHEARLPARWHILAQTGHVLALRRDPRTLDVMVPRGQSIFVKGNLFRRDQDPVAAGDAFTVPGMRATILEAAPEGPRAVRFEFDRELESEPLVWITDALRGFEPATPPRPGFGQPFDP
jgi:hypothetical protein